MPFYLQFMDYKSLQSLIIANIGHQPTQLQLMCAQALSLFICAGEDRSAFVLRGYAGTGKTTIISSLIKALRSVRYNVVLLAPTGRAAKVLSDYSGLPAYTIHKWIYQMGSGIDRMEVNAIAPNRFRDTLFVVDEASMISDKTIGDSTDLLSDLVEYVYEGIGCQLLLCGDTAQLPPVFLDYSPALDNSTLERLGLTVYGGVLTEVVRQQSDSGILVNATMLRDKINEGMCDFEFPEFDVDGYKDICHADPQELVETIASCYNKYGEDDTIIITRYNVRAKLFNQAVRARVLDRDDELCGGDSLMIVANNYYWSKTIPEMSFIANGDTASVKRVRKITELYGHKYADVTLYFNDYDVELEATVMMDLLHSDSPSLSQKEWQELYSAVEEDYMDVPTQTERRKAMRQDKYLNALQVKFAYAITAHKAQGGQWSAVFIDPGLIRAEQLDTNFYRWIYTSLTRSTKEVYLINWRCADLE